MVEKGKEYVQAARVIGIVADPHHGAARSAQRHRAGAGNRHPQSSLAIITEATFVVPRRRPAAHRARSLGTLIRIGNEVLFSGRLVDHRVSGITLAVLVLAINLLATGCATPQPEAAMDRADGRRVQQSAASK